MIKKKQVGRPKKKSKPGPKTSQVGKPKPGRPKKIQTDLSPIVDLDEMTFRTFLSYFKTGLYTYQEVCFRVGISTQEMTNIINSNALRLKEFNETMMDEKYRFAKNKLVEKSLISLEKAVTGKDEIVKKMYRVTETGQKIQVAEEVRNVGVNIKAVETVLQNFTDAFGSNFTPEQIQRILIEFNKFCIEKYDVVEFVEQLMIYEEDFIKTLFLRQQNGK